ncbi:CaiB/BaiF CoA transferase family protein [Saccharolobus islandicus]|uniref:L-carnitine dehydratase/bile acid-inducible protein F n=1 Tax=Saccharolobus islandicus (strain REY15A) TaxID=930945 RepID=F0NCL3_SACI5|nr:CaiB/BaiF CoA-transferase family protein [Sulfolobus islandicus]ADX86160.1 L-carnitine dehydratase/bile acid-inducible protein F [Sulfolobus islandicus REY15A]
MEKIRVIELGSNISAPLVGEILADLGMEVIKVEPPPHGDDRRRVKPEINGISIYFASTNRGKKSVVINLKSDEGYEIFQRLVKTANVIVTNYRPSALKRLKVDYESVKKINPKIIYCSITGFGNFTEEADRPAYDTIILALSGLMDMTGEENPVKFATSISDITTGLLASIMILWALNRGGPSFIDVPMIYTQFYLTLEDAYMYLNTGKVPRRMGSAHRYLVPYQAFKTADGYIYAAIFNDEQYLRLCKAINREDLAKFDTLQKRVENRNYIINELSRIFEKNTRDYWVNLLSKADVPIAPILNLEEAFKKYGNRLVYENEGVKYINFPINVTSNKSKAPKLGENTKEVLLELGYSEENIKKLAEKGIINTNMI